MTYRKTFASVLVAVLLTACSILPGGLAKPDLDSSKKIAVVSLLGESFHGVHVGTTIFENVAYDADVPEWGIDVMAEQTIISHIGLTGARTATALQHDSALGRRLEEGRSYMKGYDYQEVVNLAKQQGADTLLLIQPVRYDNAPFHQPGYGFFERTSFGSAHRCVYSLFVLSAFSTETGKKIGWQWGRPCRSGETELEWKDGFDKYSEQELQQLRRKTEESVQNNVLKGLAVLGY